VEDDPQDEKLTLRALHRIQIAHSVDVVRDGAEALDYLFATGRHRQRCPGELPVAMLMDSQMPGLNGLEVLAQVRANPLTRTLPVVMLTSSDNAQDLRQSYALGANSYVRKPMDPIEFTHAVMQLGLYCLSLNEPCPGK